MQKVFIYTFFTAFFTLFTIKGFHTNLYSQILSSLTVFAVALFTFTLSNKRQSLSLSDLLGLAFLLFFNFSYYFTQVPFGFKEFVTFNAGYTLYLLVKHIFQGIRLKDLQSFISQKTTLNFFSCILLIASAYFLYSFNLFLDLPNDRFAAFFQGDEAYSNYPNVLGTFLLFVLPCSYFFVARFNFAKHRFYKVVALLSFSIFSTAFFLTASRGAYLSLIVLLFVVVLGLLITRQYAQFKTFSIGFSCIFISFILAMAINNAKVYNLDYSARVSLNQDISSQASLNERFILFENGLKIGLENPLTGTGPASFQFINPSYQVHSLVNSEHPHNIFLKIFAESGVFALLFFALWIASILWFSLKHFLQTKNNYYLVALGIAFALIFNSLIDYNLGFTIIWILFFILLAILSLAQPKYPLNFKPAFVTFSAVGFLFCFYQSVIFYNLSLNTNSFAKNAPFTFKNQYLDGLETTKDKFPNYPPAYLLSSMNSEANLTKYLELDPLNNFSVYNELLSLNPAQLDLSNLTRILQRYTDLLAVNAHHTVASDNPLAVYQIYQKLIILEPNNSDIQADFLRYKQIYFAEMAKFDTRYKTNLAQTFLWQLSNQNPS